MPSFEDVTPENLHGIATEPWRKKYLEAVQQRNRILHAIADATTWDGCEWQERDISVGIDKGYFASYQPLSEAIARILDDLDSSCVDTLMEIIAEKENA